MTIIVTISFMGTSKEFMQTMVIHGTILTITNHLHIIQCQPKETERLFLIGKMAACTLNEILPENHSYG